jgi:DNA invertase Pin-like site-specific DNA recombinase
MRVVVYARYSSENQRAASLDDQIEVCRRFAEARGWTLQAIYKDAALSGSSRFRPGYQSLLSDLDRRQFDLVLVEALDRLGRKLADIADLHDRCDFAGVKLITTNLGEITPMHIGMFGTMAQVFISDLREKTWRGQLGRALQGKIPGGKAYGYDVVGTGQGERAINEAEAAVVRRIFESFARGDSPRAIAKQLNKERVAGPGGRPWGDTTIRGQFDRGTGILNNAVYVGRLEWNRCSYVKDPRTGKRVARPNPPDKWETADVPHLRIVDPDLWDRVKRRQQELQFAVARDEAGNALNHAHRRRFLLSGLLKCGVCGAGYTIVTTDRYGCAAHKSKGTCSNNLLLSRKDIEKRVLGGLKDRMMSPEIVAAFISEFNAELAKLSGVAGEERAAAKRALADIERKIAGIMKAIEDGAYNSTLKDRLTSLEGEKASLETKLADAAPAPTLRIHPNLTEVYRKKIDGLEEALTEAGTAKEAGDILRGLIQRIVLTPAEGSLKAELYGDLAIITEYAQTKDRAGAARSVEIPGDVPGKVSVVAGTRNRLDLLLVS